MLLTDIFLEVLNDVEYHHATRAEKVNSMLPFHEMLKWKEISIFYTAHFSCFQRSFWCRSSTIFLLVTRSPLPTILFVLPFCSHFLCLTCRAGVLTLILSVLTSLLAHPLKFTDWTNYHIKQYLKYSNFPLSCEQPCGCARAWSS